MFSALQPFAAHSRRLECTLTNIAVGETLSRRHSLSFRLHEWRRLIAEQKRCASHPWAPRSCLAPPTWSSGRRSTRRRANPDPRPGATSRLGDSLLQSRPVPIALLGTSTRSTLMSHRGRVWATRRKSNRRRRPPPNPNPRNAKDRCFPGGRPLAEGDSNCTRTMTNRSTTVNRLPGTAS